MVFVSKRSCDSGGVGVGLVMRFIGVSNMVDKTSVAVMGRYRSYNICSNYLSVA